LLVLLQARGFTVDAPTKARLDQATPKELEQLVARAASITSIDALFGD
jgi:hypothetical protein